MKQNRLAWAAAGILALSLVLAFPLRDVLEKVIILPLAYLLFALNLFYKSIPQFLWWVLAIIVVLVLLAGSLVPGDRYATRTLLKSPLAPGPVEELAGSIRKARGGIYFRWLVANRLGKLAYNMLVQRSGEGHRSVFAPLTGPDWEPSLKLRQYLETGLHGSFTDYPAAENSQTNRSQTNRSQTNRSQTNPGSPLDVEVEEAVNFLESQLEARRDRLR